MMIEPAKREESDGANRVPTASLPSSRQPRVRTAGESSRRGSSSSRSSKSSRESSSSSEPRSAQRRPPSGGGGSSRRRPASVSSRPGAKRKPGGSARIIAPIALIIFAIACFSVVSSKDDSGTKSDSGKAGSATKSTKAATGANGTTTVTTRKTYTVRSGDSFNSIAEKFNIDVTALTALNSDIDPRALQPGQKLKLK